MSETISMPVSGNSNAKKLAAAVHERYRHDRKARVELCAIGMAAVGQAVKGVIELNKLLAGRGTHAAILPYMEDREVKDRAGGEQHLIRTVTVFRLRTDEL